MNKTRESAVPPEGTASRHRKVWEIIARVLMLLPAVISSVMLQLAFRMSPVDKADAVAVGHYRTSVIICASVIFLSVLMAALWHRFGPRGRVVLKVLQILVLLAGPAVCFYCLEIYTHEISTFLNPDIKWLNILFFYLLALALLFISRRVSVAAGFVVALTAVAGIANCLAVQARSIPIYPWDLASAGIALSVAGNYSFTVTWQMAGSTSLLAGMFLLAVAGTAKLPLRRLWLRITAVVLSLACLGGYVGYLSTDRVWKDFKMYPYLFTPKVVVERNGFMVSFLSYLKYLKVQKPAGYGEAEIRSFMASYEHSLQDLPERLPNIIVIMNEAFSDLSVLTGGQDYWVEEDPLSFFHSLTEDTVRGWSYVSVKGGNTANSEFEFLTGMSMARLPDGCIPYQQYVTDDMPALGTQLTALGYETYGMHPYIASGWKRNTVYPRFGFEHCFFSTDFYKKTSHYRRVRGYISDQSLVNMIVDTYKALRAEGDAPMFTFAVTMQNHGGYTNAADYATFRQTIHAKGKEKKDDLTTYLSLLQLSDRAFESLISYFREVDEPTIVVMFGDHQPNDSVVNSLAAQYKVDIASTLADVQNRYVVPFVIWANYDIAEATDVVTSFNYLGAQILNVAGIPLTPAQEYLLELHRSFPAVNALGFMDEEGDFHEIREIGDHPALNRYAMLQYNYLFGSKRLEEFFTLPKTGS